VECIALARCQSRMLWPRLHHIRSWKTNESWRKTLTTFTKIQNWRQNTLDHTRLWKSCCTITLKLEFLKEELWLCR
jgi:hypothetical protein